MVSLDQVYYHLLLLFELQTRCKYFVIFTGSRQGKPRNRPSFRQILLHLDIAAADVLGTPQETYFKSQVWTETTKEPSSVKKSQMFHHISSLRANKVF